MTRLKKLPMDSFTNSPRCGNKITKSVYSAGGRGGGAGGGTIQAYFGRGGGSGTTASNTANGIETISVSSSDR